MLSNGNFTAPLRSIHLWRHLIMLPGALSERDLRLPGTGIFETFWDALACPSAGFAACNERVRRALHFQVDVSVDAVHFPAGSCCRTPETGWL